MFLLKLFHVTDKKYINAMSLAGSIGLHMVSGIVVGTLIGYFLDEWLETSPWLTGIFLILGIVAGFKNVYVDTKRLLAAQKEEEAAHDAFCPAEKNGRENAPDRKDKGGSGA